MPDAPKTQTEYQPNSCGPLLACFEASTRLSWEWLIIQTSPWFQCPTDKPEQEPTFLRRRDAAVVISFSLSIALLLMHPQTPSVFSKLAAAFAFYQVFCLTAVLLRLGILGHTRGPAGVQALPSIRVRRLLFLSVINYIELIFWFALIYLHLGLRDPSVFDKAVATRQTALFMSMSTMLTIGYGTFAPVGFAPLFLAIVEGVLSLVITASIIGTLISQAATGAARHQASTRTAPRFVLPLIFLIVWLAVFYWLL